MLCFGPGHVSNFCRAESAALSRRERVEEHNRVKYLAGLLGVSCSWVRTAELKAYSFEEMKIYAKNNLTPADADDPTRAYLSGGHVDFEKSRASALNIVAPPVTRRAT
tara:strand:- start:1 stop:324 length:324 start_codon:yes stop_codon:yes gene_type:complete